MSEVLCPVCKRPTMWTDRKGQRWSSPMMKIGKEMVHQSCISKYLQRRVKDGKQQIRINPKYAGVPLWRRILDWLGWEVGE